METLSINSMVQIIFSVLMLLGLFILTGLRSDIKSIFKVLSTFQTKDGCKQFHAAHEKEHLMEKEMDSIAHDSMKKDIDNIGNIARKSKGVQ